MKRIFLLPLLMALLAVPAFAAISYDVAVDCDCAGACRCRVASGEDAVFELDITNNSSNDIDVSAEVTFGSSPTIYTGSANNIAADGGTSSILITIPAADITDSDNFQAVLEADDGTETKSKTVYGAITVKKSMPIPEIPQNLAALFALLVAAAALVVLNKKGS